MSLPPRVSPGDKFTPSLWNQLISFVRSLQPFPGENTRITQVPGGFSISFVPPPMSWDHPFRCLLIGKELTIAVGLVNQVEPTLGGVPISGVDAKGKVIEGGAPKLTISDDYDKESRSWIALKVTQEAAGKIKKAEIEQTATWPQPLRALVAWHPLAVLKKENGQPVLHQVTYHNLGHQWLKPQTGIGRHFFWAA